MTTSTLTDRFSLHDRVAIITGGGGLLGEQHAIAVAEAGGTSVLWDIKAERASHTAESVTAEYGSPCTAMAVDITDHAAITTGLAEVIAKFGNVHILINNAAVDPKVESDGDVPSSRLEVFSRERWDMELAVGLTGSFLCAQVVGSFMASAGNGVILNIASDLSVIAPDQRIYRKDGVADHLQPTKPVTYSVIKHGLIGLTRYLATYWAEQGIRCNALAPGGIYVDQPDAFVEKLTNLIPMGRMAKKDEYRGAIQFLCSDASRYMNGTCVVMDGGRSVW